MAETPVKYDLDSYDTLTRSIDKLLNQYPGLSGDEIRFSVLSEDGGKAWFPSSGAVIESEIKTILGEVWRTCLYPFIVVYRVSGVPEARKVAVKEWLDDLGRWLERQTLTGVESVYDTTLTRTTPAYLDGTESNQAENWVIAAQLKYKTHTKN